MRVYIHRFNTLEINGYRLFSKRCIYTAWPSQTHKREHLSMKGVARQTGVYIHRLNTLVINGYRLFPQGVYTPLIGHSF